MKSGTINACAARSIACFHRPLPPWELLPLLGTWRSFAQLCLHAPRVTGYSTAISPHAPNSIKLDKKNRTCMQNSNFKFDKICRICMKHIKWTKNATQMCNRDMKPMQANQNCNLDMQFMQQIKHLANLTFLPLHTQLLKNMFLKSLRGLRTSPGAKSGKKHYFGSCNIKLVAHMFQENKR